MRVDSHKHTFSRLYAVHVRSGCSSMCIQLVREKSRDEDFCWLNKSLFIVC